MIFNLCIPRYEGVFKSIFSYISQQKNMLWVLTLLLSTISIKQKICVLGRVFFCFFFWGGGGGGGGGGFEK